MTIFDKTADLAASIKASEEYADFLRCKKKLSADPQAVDLLREYRQYQVAMEFARFAEDNADEIDSAMGDFYTRIENKDSVGEYLTAEYNLARLIQRIQSILMDGLDLYIDADWQENNRYLN